jgi:hypothetical protein
MSFVARDPEILLALPALLLVGGKRPMTRQT